MLKFLQVKCSMNILKLLSISGDPNKMESKRRYFYFVLILVK